jgi:hypothetical protein
MAINRKEVLGFSIGENKVRTFLFTMGIDYETEKEFDDLINPKTGAKLRFDFYIDSLKMAVEYDHMQHFTAKSKFHTNKDDFYAQRYRDNLKNKYCKERDIMLVRVTCFNKTDLYITLNKHIKTRQNERQSQSKVSTK